MNNSLRIYFVPTLLSKHFLSPGAQGQQCPWVSEVSRVPRSRAWFVHGSWICPCSQHSTGFPEGLRTSMKLFRHRLREPWHPQSGKPRTPLPSSVTGWGDGHLKTWVLCCHSCPSPTERGNPVEEDAFNHIIFPGPATHVSVSNGKAPAEARAQVQRQVS